jgi:hypothetical protein
VHQTGRKHYEVEKRGRGFKERRKKVAHLPRGYCRECLSFLRENRVGTALDF